jgi:hypothetical protein
VFSYKSAVQRLVTQSWRTRQGVQFVQAIVTTVTSAVGGPPCSSKCNTDRLGPGECERDAGYDIIKISIRELCRNDRCRHSQFC